MLVCTLDVPVNFFAGDLNRANGTLQHKPNVARWVVPGVALQLAVNPAMKHAKHAIATPAAAASRAHLTPTRVLHWLLWLEPLVLALDVWIFVHVRRFLREHPFRASASRRTGQTTVTSPLRGSRSGRERSQSRPRQRSRAENAPRPRTRPPRIAIHFRHLQHRSILHLQPSSTALHGDLPVITRRCMHARARDPRVVRPTPNPQTGHRTPHLSAPPPSRCRRRSGVYCRRRPPSHRPPAATSYDTAQV